MSGRGGILSLFIYGGFKMGGLACARGYLDGRVGLCAGVYTGGLVCALGFTRAGWLVRGGLHGRVGLCAGVYTGGLACAWGLHGRVGLCVGVIRKKNDNRYGKVQKIDLRNTLRRMKNKRDYFS